MVVGRRSLERDLDIPHQSVGAAAEKTLSCVSARSISPWGRLILENVVLQITSHNLARHMKGHEPDVHLQQNGICLLRIVLYHKIKRESGF